MPPLLEKFRALAPEWETGLGILAVNDGSSDNSQEVLEQWREKWPAVAILEHDGNQGLGRALLTGLSAALERGGPGDLVLVMDADDTHDPAFVAGLLKAVASGADVAIASRFHDGGEEIGVPFLRLMLSRLGKVYMSLLVGIPEVQDYTCSYRIYRWEVVQKMRERFGEGFIEESGFSCMVEALMRAHSVGAVLKEAPFTLRYDRKATASKMQIARTAWRTLTAVARLRKALRNGP